jgi:AbrB family looped-hinge helix DNA binding protein
MLNTSTISTKGQVTIPKPIRDHFNLGESDKLAFAIVGDNLIVKPIKRDFLEFGASVEPVNKPENFNEVRKKVMKKVAQKIAEK